MDDILKQLDQDIQTVLADLRQELAGLRTGRASTILVENIVVDSYGSKLPIKQLSSISVVPPKEITISVWDQSIINTVAKAIETSNLGITPQVDGNVIHINLPPLTQERRLELIKLAGKVCEEQKIRLRSSRDEANKKAKELAVEDERFTTKDKVQESIDEANKEIENLLKSKTEEINQ